MVTALLAAELWIAGGTLVSAQGERQVAVQVSAGRIARLADEAPAGANLLDAKGLWLAPAVIDAHVHLSVAGELPAVAQAELRAGIAAVLDLGEPERLLPRLAGLAPLHVLFAGPLLTAPLGYPTQSWGKDGYGLPLSTPAEARAAVGRLQKAGARMIKLAFDDRYPVLSPEVAKAAVDAAHALGLNAAAHALGIKLVRRALDAGCDVLAHTPVEPLPEDLVTEIGARRLWVVSTLKAFGGSATAVENLRHLRAAGARVVYGTDLGNAGTAPGVDAGELALLSAAGLSAPEILQAATAAPAELLGLGGLGALAEGREASLLALKRDPRIDPTALSDAAWVLIGGVRQ